MPAFVGRQALPHGISRPRGPLHIGRRQRCTWLAHFSDFAQVLIRIARPLHAADPIGVDLEQSVYALDSTTIDLCLSLFPWAKFRKHKAAVKMQTLLDLHGNIPTFISITDGKVHDVNILDEILPETVRATTAAGTKRYAVVPIHPITSTGGLTNGGTAFNRRMLISLSV